jgi:hypothetical protein
MYNALFKFFNSKKMAIYLQNIQKYLKKIIFFLNIQYLQYFLKV